MSAFNTFLNGDINNTIKTKCMRTQVFNYHCENVRFDIDYTYYGYIIATILIYKIIIDFC